MKNSMDKKLFIDTWGWLTLRDKTQKKHEKVSKFLKEYIGSGGLLYTTDYVLDETFTLLFRRLSLSEAESSMKLILNSLKAGEFYLEWITPERFIRAWKFRQKFRNKTLISFTDMSSMVIMQEIGIRQILTEDAHFNEVELGFQPVCT